MVFCNFNNLDSWGLYCKEWSKHVMSPALDNTTDDRAVVVEATDRIYHNTSATVRIIKGRRGGNESWVRSATPLAGE